jgi:hypothetical protein
VRDGPHKLVAHSLLSLLISIRQAARSETIIYTTLNPVQSTRFPHLIFITMASFWNILLSFGALSSLFTVVSACGLIFRRPDALAYTNGDGAHYKPDGEYVKVNCNDCEIGKYQRVDVSLAVF